VQFKENIFQAKGVGEKKLSLPLSSVWFCKLLPLLGRKYQQLSKGDRIKIHTLLFCNKT